MYFFEAKSEIKSPKHAYILATAGLIIVLTYKLWKYFLRRGIDPIIDYYAYEAGATCFRVLGTLMGLFLIRWAYTKPRAQLKIGNHLIGFVNILIIIPLFFLFRSQYFVFALNTWHFGIELFFNFFVGTFEELMFRGALFASLFYFLGVARAALLSSLIFSLWHLDVTTDVSSLFFMFLYGVFDCYCYYLGATLLSLSIFHFLWDQVRYGIQWQGYFESNEVTQMMGLYSLVAVIIILLITKKLEKRS